ncbi:MAG: TIGR04255 family protein [Segetibacter sp.]
MSKLPKAPLLEVIYELRWDIKNEQDLVKFQYLHGDLYAAQKINYPSRELLTPADMPMALMINNPVYRFKSKEGYPLFQLGPGILSLNTTDATYFWKDYYVSCKSLTSSFLDVYQLTNEEKFRPNLIYLDFYKFDFLNDDVITFINDNLNIVLSQHFFKTTNNPSTINLAFNYITELGKLDILLNSGLNGSNETGLIIRTQLNGPVVKKNTDEIMSWLDKAHTFCSGLFKEMTKGKLYETFK